MLDFQGGNNNYILLPPLFLVSTPLELRSTQRSRLLDRKGPLLSCR